MLAIHQWLIVALAAVLVAQDTTAGPQLRFSEPIVSGPIIGWLLGDVTLGLIIGVAAELIWCGQVPAGTTEFVDVNVSTVATVTLATILVDEAAPRLLTMAVALAWIIPVGLLGSALTTLGRGANSALVASVRPEADRPWTIGARHLAGWAVSGARGLVTAAVGIPIGLLVVPPIVALLAPYVDPPLLWAGILGAGGGTAIGVTWRYSRGRATLLGAMITLALWAVIVYGR